MIPPSDDATSTASVSSRSRPAPCSLFASTRSPTVALLASSPASSRDHRLWRRRMTSFQEIIDMNRVFCSSSMNDSTFQQLTSDTTIEVTIDIPFPFRALPVEAIESSGRQVLEQLLRVMLPRFLKQLVKDYHVC